MTYSNYVNYHVNEQKGIPAGAVSYSNAVWYRDVGTTPYGFIASQTFSYTNYCNSVKAPPETASITASNDFFSAGQHINQSVVNEIKKLRADLEKLSVDKVGKTAPITYTPTFTACSDANLEQAKALNKTQIVELRDRIQQLWNSIQPDVGAGTWPDLTAVNPGVLSAQITQLRNNAEALAQQAQPRGYGYLNCCNTNGSVGAAGSKDAVVNATTYNNSWEPSAGGNPSHLYGAGPANIR
jgi:hypothetical protein